MKAVLSRFAIGLIGLMWLACAQAREFDLEGYLESVRSKHDLPALAAAVTKDGDIVTAVAVGTRVHGMSIPVSIDDRFHIGSDTKAMTATLAGMMVDEGKLGWASTIGEVLGDDVEAMNPALAAATLGQLLSHSSGIPSDTQQMLQIYFNADVFDFNLPEWRRKALEAWKDNAPVVPEGSPFQYANFGYMIAGMMIEKVAGLSWEALIHQRLFEPLGLASAGLGPQTSIGLIDAPVGHRIGSDGRITPMFWGPASDVPPLLGPAGSSHMSILDFARWAAWNAGVGKRGPALVRLQTLSEIHKAHVQTPHRENPPPGTPADGGYGFGWGIVMFDWAAKPLLTHNGSNSMNLAKILVDPEHDLGIVVTTNFPDRAAELATGDVMQRLYEEYGPR